MIGQSETPKGLLDLRIILEEACKDDANLKFECFVFGSDDYLASIGKDLFLLLWEIYVFVLCVYVYQYITKN